MSSCISILVVNRMAVTVGAVFGRSPCSKGVDADEKLSAPGRVPDHELSPDPDVPDVAGTEGAGVSEDALDGDLGKADIASTG
jgi:hypothetical protein